MSENVPYYLGGCSESNRGVSSFSNIEVNTSKLSDKFGVTTTTTTTIRDDTAKWSTEKGIEGGGLLEDIFKVLSEVPLHTTKTLHESFHHNLEASTSKNEECFMQQKREIESHDYTNIVAQRSQLDEGTKANEETSQLVFEPTHTPPSDESHDHIPTRRRNREQRRRDRINVKLRALQALLPHSNKKDHASILDNAINHIKYLKLQVEMMPLALARAIGQSEHQASDNPFMIFGGTGCTHRPLHFPMAEPSTHPLMIRPNFPVRPMSHFPVTPHFAPQTISPLLLPQQPSPPIRLWPPIPYIGVSSSTTDRATGPSSTMGQCTRIFSETNRQ